MIVGELGRGAFARVYLAKQENLGNRLVALKVSRAEGDEPQILARLQHTHIVPIHSVHDDPHDGPAPDVHALPRRGQPRAGPRGRRGEAARAGDRPEPGRGARRRQQPSPVGHGPGPVAPARFPRRRTSPDAMALAPGGPSLRGSRRSRSPIPASRSPRSRTLDRARSSRSGPGSRGGAGPRSSRPAAGRAGARPARAAVPPRGELRPGRRLDRRPTGRGARPRHTRGACSTAT